jgi:hypothetical protein
MKIKYSLILLLSFWVVCYPCSAYDIVFFDISDNKSSKKRQVEIAGQFYGIDIKKIMIDKGLSKINVKGMLKKETPQAYIFTGEALIRKDAIDLLSYIHESSNKSIPFLFMGLTSMADSSFLKEWSGGEVLECSKFISNQSPIFFKVSDSKGITRELAGQTLPLNQNNGYYFVLKPGSSLSPIVEIAGGEEKPLPLFVKTINEGRKIFFQSEIEPSNPQNQPIWHYESKNFSDIAALMMFLRYSCGDKCWHSINDFANLTIDDPWLTEPYGHLSYKGLLSEMEKYNYHTTIAFVAWNFDRSSSEVVSIFQDHPNRFSVCIHGNNHDHYEFYKYNSNMNDPRAGKTHKEQEENIKQAVARMEIFKESTGIPYDRVMVFPQGIAPSKTLGLLKKYNFHATVNSVHIPLGSEKPLDPLFQFRPVTLHFSNFPSFTRYSPLKRRESEIAIDLFLDNPVLLMEHQNYFENGINRFNRIAEMINRIQPEVRWQSLGSIIQNYYLIKLRDDGNYDTLIFSNNVRLRNERNRDTIFFVTKEESNEVPIRRLRVDGADFFYEKENSSITLEIPITAGAVRHLVIEYENDLDFSSIDVSKSNFGVHILRRLSDFRDITLSKSGWGRALTNFYYGTNIYKLGLIRLCLITFCLALFMTFVIFYSKKRKK